MSVRARLHGSFHAIDVRRVAERAENGRSLSTLVYEGLICVVAGRGGDLFRVNRTSKCIRLHCALEGGPPTWLINSMWRRSVGLDRRGRIPVQAPAVTGTATEERFMGAAEVTGEQTASIWACRMELTRSDRRSRMLRIINGVRSGA